jgi:hypothetical protein
MFLATVGWSECEVVVASRVMVAFLWGKLLADTYMAIRCSIHNNTKDFFFLHFGS